MAHQIEMDQFHRPLAGAFVAEQLQNQRCDEHWVGLDGHAFERFHHHVTVAENTFHPLQKPLDLPAVEANQGDQLRFDLQIGGEQQFLAIRFDFDDADRLAPLGDTRRPVRFC
jgi:hypothetical protein